MALQLFVTIAALLSPGVALAATKGPSFVFAEPTTASDPFWAANDVAVQTNLGDAWRHVTGGRWNRTNVCIIGTGFDARHEDLAANVAATWSAITNSHTVTTMANDGTAAAGVVGATGNNELGVAGVAWRTRLLLCQANSYATILSCLSWCRAHKPRVVLANYKYTSAAGDEASILTSHALEIAEIKKMQEDNTIFVTGAGDEDQKLDAGSLRFPACYHHLSADLDNMVVVGSVNADNRRAENSNYGSTCVHLFARGEKVLTIEPGNSYANKSSTDLASALVAGTTALLSIATPLASYRSVKEALLSSVNPCFMPEDSSTGGTLNAGKAMTALGLATPVQIPSKRSGTSCLPPQELAVMFRTRLSSANALCMDAGVERGANLTQQHCQIGNPNQVFQVSYFGAWGCEHFIRNKGSCVQVPAESADIGTYLNTGECQSPWSTKDNQCWTFSPYSNAFQIRARHSSMCMDVSQGLRSTGTLLWQWDCHRQGVWNMTRAQIPNQIFDVYVMEENLVNSYVNLRIGSSNNTQCIQASKQLDGADVTLQLTAVPCSRNRDSQLFQISRTGVSAKDDAWAMRIQRASRTVTVEHDQAVLKRPESGSKVQTWSLIRPYNSAISGPYFLANRGTNMCLDMSHAPRVYSRPCTFSKSQEFTMEVWL